MNIGLILNGCGAMDVFLSLINAVLWMTHTCTFIICVLFTLQNLFTVTFWGRGGKEPRVFSTKYQEIAGDFPCNCSSVNKEILMEEVCIIGVLLSVHKKVMFS